MRLDATFLPIGHVPGCFPAADSVRVADFQQWSRVAGPGVRSVLWVAGCHRRCPGCIKPEWFDFDAGKSVLVSDAHDMLTGVSGTDGVSFSGGEPFEQAPALASLAGMVRASGRNVLVYTGYRYEFLVASDVAAFRDLLAVTDILVEGEYRAEVGGAGRWRGSSNQRVMPLTVEGRRALAEESAAGATPGDVQIVFEHDALRITGCPDVDFMKRISKELAVRGIELRASRVHHDDT